MFADVWQSKGIFSLTENVMCFEQKKNPPRIECEFELATGQIIMHYFLSSR